MSPATRNGRSMPKRSFHPDLVLNRWMLGFFHGGTLEALKTRIADDRFEGLDDDGQTRFFHELVHGLFDPNRIPEDDLRRYDLHIVSYWQAITTAGRNTREGHELQLKYFQYLSLLFADIYLDWYFNHRQELLDGLNAEMQRYREEPGAEPFCDYTADDLNKIAFWNATGSGKTLLMHVNIRQYLHYFQAGNTHHHPDKIILLTPNEGLSRQHLGELKLSGFKGAKLFDKYKADGLVQVIDINKLADTMGEKTVAVEAFEGNNLVLVDEGHRGTGKEARAWMRRRHALVSDGFAFEYSATFGQVAAKGLTVVKAEEEIYKAHASVYRQSQFPGKKVRELSASEKKTVKDFQDSYQLSADEKQLARRTATREVYAKCILFDYSYKYFYEDGYGKESLILNMDGEAYDTADNAYKYFTACLLAFYQQLWLWNTHQGKLAEFNIEKPLWIFVGNTVSGEDSDILEVVTFLAWFLNHDQQVKAWLADLVADRAQILDSKGNNIFHARFQPLMGFSDDVAALYADILHRVFNASAHQRLKMVNIRNSKGELVLRVGDAEPFGLINVGDEGNVFKAAEDRTDFDTERDDFGQTLFHTLNDKSCLLNVLIGSRKFTEGWSSWRVSTMGLLNMGQGEGSQIIQLFGRGVRLKGKGFSLKRTLPHERPKGAHLDKLEALNIFGVRANYMAAFKDYLREEGITPTDEILELDFRTKANLPDGKLKTLALKDGYKDNQKLGFKRQRFPWLYEIPADMQGKIKSPHVVVDLYPRVEALATANHKKALADTKSRNEGKLDKALFAMFDWDRIYLTVQDYKLMRGWSNLRLDRQRLIDVCHGSRDWYTLYIPVSELDVASFDDVRAQEAILTRLLIDYTDRFYKALKTGYEGQFYEVVQVSEQDGSILEQYQFEIENTDEGLDYHNKLDRLKQLVASGDIGKASQWNAPHMVAISFDRHLFYPLFGFESDADKQTVPLKLRPLGLDAPSEIRFIRDLEDFYNSPQAKSVIGDRSLYLLRNASHKRQGPWLRTGK